MSLTERTIKVGKSVPRLIDQLLSGQQVELVPDRCSVAWPANREKLIRLTEDRITFEPAATLYLEWWGVTVHTELHYLTVADNGHTVIVSITGPDITLRLEPEDE